MTRVKIILGFLALFVGMYMLVRNDPITQEQYDEVEEINDEFPELRDYIQACAKDYISFGEYQSILRKRNRMVFDGE